MIFQISKNRNYTVAPGSLVRCTKGVLLSFTFIIAFSMGTAWSYESVYQPITKNNNVSFSGALLKTKIPPSTVMDMCKSLLKSTQYKSSHIATSGSQRTAGKIAVLGIILGARFALEPKNNENISVTSVKSHTLIHQKLDNNRSAQAVVAYRRCQKEHALNKVADAH